jgi:hypothetical protein
MKSLVRPIGVAAVAAALASTGCQQRQDDAPPVATPSFSASRPRAALGSPIDVTYRFVAASDAAFDQDYRVLVHFLDSDEELMWTDDHWPAMPTSQWKPGQTVEYTRTIFIPIYPYIGDASILMGLYSVKDSSRLPLAGENTGQRSYRVGTLALLPQSENVFLIYKEGWHPAEPSQENPAVEWQWTKKEATISFRNPKRASTFFLHYDARPDLFDAPLQVVMTIEDRQVDAFSISSRDEVIRRTPLSPDQLGSGDMVELKIAVDRTFVPALTPAAKNNDPRELGIRVFHAFVEPK